MSGSGGLVTWASPGPALALVLGGGYELDEFGPHFRVEGYMTSGSREDDQREASFDGYGGRLEGCPIAAGVRRLLRLEPCVATYVGISLAEGMPSDALPTTRTDESFWFSASLVAACQLPERNTFSSVRARTRSPFPQLALGLASG
jgi:hypothetical protein